METPDKTARMSQILGNAMDIPTLPLFLTQILELADKSTTSAEDLNAIISKDPSLTVQILRAANSAFYGFPTRIGTVTLAIIILGFHMVKTIALSSWVLKLFKETGSRPAPFDVTAFWTHSFKCGVACRMLATNYRHFVAGEAFTAGILHDIGRIALAHHAPGRYEEVVRHLTQNGGTFLKAEDAVLGFNHADLGGFLLRQWNLPVLIIEGVQCHHLPSAAQQAPEMAAITHLADYLCHLDSREKGEESETPILSPQVWKTLTRTESERGAVRHLLGSFREELRKSESFFEILKENSLRMVTS